MKRIFLFLATNVAIMITLSIVLSLVGFTGYFRAGSLDYVALMMFSLVWGFGGAFISLLMSRWLAKMAMGVQLVDGRTGHADLDWLFQTVEQLTRKAGLPMPEVGVYESPEVNAFATGSSKRSSLVAVSSGLLRSMRREETEAVLAHEVTHIQNGDMVTMTLIQGVVNAFTLFFSRVIANIIRQVVDERISHLVFFISTIGPRQHDRRAAAPGRQPGPGRQPPAATGDHEDQRRQAHRLAPADGHPPAARRAHRRPSTGSVTEKGTCHIFTVYVNQLRAWLRSGPYNLPWSPKPSKPKGT